MHASFNDLVRLRDHPHLADAGLLAHVRSCSQCGEELRLLEQRTNALRRLPTTASAPDRWQSIQRALTQYSSETAPVRARPAWWLAASSAAVVVVAVLVTVQPDNIDVSEQAAGNLPMTDSADATDSANLLGAPRVGLIEESQRLELLLAEFPESPRVTRASTALTVADLEDRIQWVDYRLNMVHEAGLDPDQSQPLWRERVDLLNSLVAVRYAEARTLAF